MKQVRISNISKTYSSFGRGDVVALREINLDVKPGTFFVLLGPSGCGKSTLLNIIAGLERPTKGEIWIGEQQVVSTSGRVFLSPRERDIAMVFQSYALYPHMTVAENIGFPLKIARVPRDEIVAKVRQVASSLELTELLSVRPAELSGGQRQRVALGRAIVREPNLLLLDEPLSNLDALLRISMRAELKQIQRRLGLTTIYVTHDQAEAMTMGDLIAILKEGSLQQLGTSEHIYRDPANLFVARFVGNPPANLLMGDVLNAAATRLGLTSDMNYSQLVAALRPEDIQIASEEQGVLAGTVRLVATLGAEALVYVSVGESDIIVKATGSLICKEGDRVGLAFAAEKLMLFGKRDESRIRL